MAVRRQKLPYVVLSFATTSAAMAMDQACMKKKIPGRLIPLPNQISAGCGFGWRIGAEEYHDYAEEIDALGIDIEKRTEIIL